MPFNEPSSLTVTVTAQDIAASEASLGNGNNIYVNSLAKCLYRLNQSHSLPGQDNDSVPQDGCLFFADTQVRLQNGQFVSICDVLVCSAVYSADTATALKIAAENVAGLKPNEAYTVQLVKA